ncbi:MAG: Pr6Pr family membrane protein [Clostridiales bacterium]|jgi:hypothetical protein|nr:Pr6Pr family membrane protein [Clostridiales bacterium]
MIYDRRAALAVRVTFFLFILFGLLDCLGVFRGKPGGAMFMYYTIQSNVLALALFGVLTVLTARALVRDGKRGKTGYLARFEMVCTIDLLLTLTAYWALLAPTLFKMNADYNQWSFANLSVHLFAPLFCLIDYILFAPNDSLKYRDVFFVLIFPFFYILFSAIAGLSGYVYAFDAVGVPSRAPYFFIDWFATGAMPLIYILALVVFFLIISHILYLLDKRWQKPALCNSAPPPLGIEKPE